MTIKDFKLSMYMNSLGTPKKFDYCSMKILQATPAR